MSKLEDFLGLNDVSEIRETIKEVIGGKELEFVIKPLTNAEHTDFQKRCQNISKKSVSFDTGKYDNLVLATCIVEPDLSSVEFLEKAKCQTANDFITKKFPAGVVADISQKIQQLSGFESFELDIEEAKN